MRAPDFEIDQETQRLVDAIAKGHGDPAILGAKIGELKTERDRAKLSSPSRMLG